MYVGVPMMVPSRVLPASPSEVRIFATPKSSTFTKSSWPRGSMTKRLSGFTSRCTTPTLWAAPSAAHTCTPMRWMRASVSGASCMTAARLCPRSSSITQ